MLNSRGGGMHHSLLYPGTEASLTFICIKVNALLKPEWGRGGAGVSNDWCIIYRERLTDLRINGLYTLSIYLDDMESFLVVEKPNTLFK